MAQAKFKVGDMVRYVKEPDPDSLEKRWIECAGLKLGEIYKVHDVCGYAFIEINNYVLDSRNFILEKKRTIQVYGIVNWGNAYYKEV